MKLRVRQGSRSEVIDFEGLNPNEVNLEILKQNVLSQFNLNNSTDIQLSLNRIDVLTGEEQTLDTFGIVSGDLIHIIGPNFPEANHGRNAGHMQNRPQPLASNLSSDAFSTHQQQSVINSVSSYGQAARQPENDAYYSSSEPPASPERQVILNDSSSLMDVTDDPRSLDGAFSAENGVNRYLQEPLVVRESTETQVPVLLAQIFQSTNCSSNSDAVWAVLHTLMLESGFLPSETKDPAIMPSNWKFPGYYSCSYDYIVTADSVGTCSLVGVTVGASIILHALVKSNPNFKTEHMQLRCTDFVRTLSQNAASSYRALDRLSRLFKDTITLAVIDELVTAAGFPGRQGLYALPYEVKLRMFSFLDPRSLCRLGQTCQEFNFVCRDKTLWRLQYIIAFGKPEDCNLTRNWQELFRIKYAQFKQDQEQRRHILYLDETDPPWIFPRPGPFHLLRPGTAVPHVLGGDYDLNPFYGGGIPTPLGGMNPVSPLQPQAGIPDPFFPRLGGLGQPGRPKPGPGNLTGSPFFNHLRGPFL